MGLMLKICINLSILFKFYDYNMGLMLKICIMPLILWFKKDIIDLFDRDRFNTNLLFKF
jgi:hypothetical protein